PLLGAYRSVRGGHRINTMILSALYENRSAWTVVESERSYVRDTGHANAGVGLPQPVFAADRG
ncbi:MAG: UDP-3-O-[3-hydroxymyristoyl] N-acetylglucosamine deacetylase, partial [Rhodomicrobium sp.]|nr:UDP-3-O-[3-hydroxymyristoyl] N-acetylglucosamine deacetylase [Rhodomicrobium sp.]